MNPSAPIPLLSIPECPQAVVIFDRLSRFQRFQLLVAPPHSFTLLRCRLNVVLTRDALSLGPQRVEVGVEGDLSGRK